MTITSIADLTPDPRNARKHTPRNVGMIEQAMGEVGAARSIVIDEDGVVLAGNATIEAAAQAGIERVQVVDVDGETIVAVRRTGLTPEQKTKLALYDNRAAELADWDAGVLAALAEETDLSQLFRPEEWAAILEEAAQPVDIGGAGDDFDATPSDGSTRTQVGELWEIGPHRLLVGDCTDPANVERLMGGERAQAVVCDLPYGSTGCAWDDVIPFDELWSMYAEHTDDNAAIVLTSSQPFTSALIGSRFDWFKHCWVWNKKLSGNFLLAERQPLKIHEDVCVFSRGDYTYSPQMREGVKRLKGGNGRSKLWGVALTGNTNDTYYPVSIIEIGNTDRSSIEHPTQKPVELFAYLIGTYSRRGDVVLDNTAGSGTTLIAAHELGRVARLCELSPAYADVILRRAEAAGLSVARGEA